MFFLYDSNEKDLVLKQDKIISHVMQCGAELLLLALLHVLTSFCSLSLIAVDYDDRSSPGNLTIQILLCGKVPFVPAVWKSSISCCCVEKFHSFLQCRRSSISCCCVEKSHLFLLCGRSSIHSSNPTPILLPTTRG